MHAETFLKEFAPLASGPGGIEKLRELVLQLAVRGRLSSPLPDDDDVQDLVPRSRELIKQHIASGIGAKRKEMEYDSSNPPYRVPASWRWTRLDEVASYIQRGKSPTYAQSGSVKIISQKCIQWSGFLEGPCRFLDDEAFGKFGRERLIRTGDLLWNSTGTGTIGRVNVFDGTQFGEQAFVADSHVTVVRLANCDPRYVWCYLASPDVQKNLESDASGSTNQVELSSSYVRNTWLPLPPLAEQKRIVAKVGELMALCDELETRQQEETKLKRSAAASALHHLTEASTPEETAERWSLIAPRFSELFDDLETIAKFNAVILELGADGRLDRIAGVSKRHHSKVPISRCVKVFGGGTPSKQITNYWNGDIPWITPKDMKVAELSDSIDRLSRDALAETNVKLLPANAVLTVVRGMILAKTFPVAISRVPATINQDMKALICDNLVLPEYLSLTLNGSRRKVLEQVERSTHGTCRLDTNKLLSVPIRLLEPDEQIAVVAKVDELIALFERLAMEVRESEQLNAELMASLAHSLTETDPGDGGPALASVRVAETTLSFVAPDAANDEAGEQSGSTSVRTAPTSEAERREVPTGAVEVDTRFKEAVLVGAIVKAFFEAGGEPIGNFRLQKAVYFARRHNGEHVDQMDYLKKAAGPYNPSMKYSGGIAIAKQKSWLLEARGRFGFGHVPGPTASEIDDWIARYGYDESARWVAEHFRFKKNEEWETLATIDYAMEHLQSVGIEPDATHILQYIRSDDEWRPKIEKLGLTEVSVEAVTVEVRALFGEEGKEGAT